MMGDQGRFATGGAAAGIPGMGPWPPDQSLRIAALEHALEQAEADRLELVQRHEQAIRFLLGLLEGKKA